jgi:hypothetical protein
MVDRAESSEIRWAVFPVVTTVVDATNGEVLRQIIDAALLHLP